MVYYNKNLESNYFSLFYVREKIKKNKKIKKKVFKSDLTVLIIYRT